MSTGYLVLGASGMLGRAWMALLKERGLDAVGLSRPNIDVLDASSVEAAIDGSRQIVINCTAYTDVDGAEQDEAAATALNGNAVGTMVARCDAVGARLVHYSTDYVFDGRERAEPYSVEHPTAPLGAYGRSKLVGEEHVRASAGAHLVIRTSWLYAPWSNNFVRTMARLGTERNELRVVDDQRGRPTSAEHLASTSLALCDADARGVFHVTDGGACSWYELASRVVHAVSPDCDVQPCTSAEFPRPAPRPAYSVLDLSKTEALLGPMPAWTALVDGVVERLPS